MLGQEIQSMNKSELREYAISCEEERTRLNGQLRTAELDYESVRIRLDDTNRQLDVYQRGYEGMASTNEELKERQYNLELLCAAKQALAAALQAELMAMKAAEERSEKDHDADALPARMKSDFLEKMCGYGVEFGNHSIRLELAAIHVPWQSIKNPVDNGYSPSTSVHFGRTWYIEDVFFSVQEAFDVSVPLLSEEGHDLSALGLGHYLKGQEARRWLTVGMDILKGKLMTLNFNTGASNDFFLNGLKELEYRSKNVAWNHRLVLNLVDENEQGISIDVVDWNDELFLGVTAKTLEVLGADFDFNRTSEVSYSLNRSTLRHPGYARGGGGEAEEWYDFLSKNNTNATLRIIKAMHTISFSRPEDESCEGVAPLEPDMLLFRMTELDGSNLVDEVVTVDEEVEVNRSECCWDCLPISTVDVEPYHESCAQEGAGDRVWCSELALMQLVQSSLKYPPIARDANIQGIVNVRFVVTTNGTISDVQVLVPVDQRLDAEALRVVSALPAIQPAMKDGQAVPVEMCLPVRFSLW
jgi:TonB family protein